MKPHFIGTIEAYALPRISDKKVNNNKNVYMLYFQFLWVWFLVSLINVVFNYVFGELSLNHGGILPWLYSYF